MTEPATDTFVERAIDKQIKQLQKILPDFVFSPYLSFVGDIRCTREGFVFDIGLGDDLTRTKSRVLESYLLYLTKENQ
jgi:hypothetical protein